MVNLKADLLNELRNQKYYSEIELVRLAQDATVNYKDKISAIDNLLGEITTINQKMGLADAYFAEPEAAPAPAPAPAAPSVEQQVVQQGQSHGE